MSDDFSRILRNEQELKGFVRFGERFIVFGGTTKTNNWIMNDIDLPDNHPQGAQNEG